MKKKTLIQLIVALIFFGIASYVIYGFLSSSKEKESLEAGIGVSKESELSIDDLLKKSFKNEQVDIFSDPKFKELKDYSVEIPMAAKAEIGKRDPFEERK
jgi:hypothetical protein